MLSIVVGGCIGFAMVVLLPPEIKCKYGGIDAEFLMATCIAIGMGCGCIVSMLVCRTIV